MILKLSPSEHKSRGNELKEQKQYWIITIHPKICPSQHKNKGNMENQGNFVSSKNDWAYILGAEIRGIGMGTERKTFQSDLDNDPGVEFKRMILHMITVLKGGSNLFQVTSRQQQNEMPKSIWDVKIDFQKRFRTSRIRKVTFLIVL